MLHLIAETSLSPSVTARVVDDDDVILQAGAVWAAFKGHSANLLVRELLGRNCAVYALQDALSISGIAEHQLLEGVQIIDYLAFVELTVKNPVIHTWC